MAGPSVYEKVFHESKEAAGLIISKGPQLCQEAKNSLTIYAQQWKEQLEILKEFAEPKYQAFFPRFKEVTEDLGPVEMDSSTRELLCRAYIWSAVCLFVLGFGQLIGNYVFPLRFFMGPWMNHFLTFFALPGWLLFFILRYEHSQPEFNRRMVVLGVSLALGVMSGRDLACTRIYIGPLFLLPLSIGVAVEFLRETVDRKRALAVLVGPAAVGYVALGVVSGWMGMPYLLWLSGNCVNAALFLHIQFGMDPEMADPVLLQYTTVITSFLFQALFLAFSATAV